ncbi:hypothetical protein [Vibrio sp. ER1A]|uniref:hypothetical protein n=1 Tax=Vibrio sp. ER1A TaxID=1517681 RepID=UPI0004DD2348|nr:hypothetical protein [Vibrio sp. ER1A]KFA94926.1 hypothetical protein HW45_28740 [Vibrio sp. ER1A]
MFNKRNVIATLILSVLATPVLAKDAVLNVEGEIQINGKTVIDNTGKFVGGTSTTQAEMINPEDYTYRKLGKYTYGYSYNDFVTVEENRITYTADVDFRVVTIEVDGNIETIHITNTMPNSGGTNSSGYITREYNPVVISKNAITGNVNKLYSYKVIDSSDSGMVNKTYWETVTGEQPNPLLMSKGPDYTLPDGGTLDNCVVDVQSVWCVGYGVVVDRGSKRNSLAKFESAGEGEFKPSANIPPVTKKLLYDLSYIFN